MKKILLFSTAIILSLSLFAQGKGKGKEKHGKGNVQTAQGYASHQPKKVTEAFYRDYPGAANVTWSKYRGDYTAAFNNGPWRSTAVYHANGERRDTRTVITRNDLPGTVWDQIFKRDRVTPTQYVVIERPSLAEKIFRVLSGNSTAYYYDAYGNRVQYDY